MRGEPHFSGRLGRWLYDETDARVIEAERNGQYQRYLEAIKDLVQTYSIMERVLSESATNNCASQRLKDRMEDVAEAITRCLVEFPDWMIEEEP